MGKSDYLIPPASLSIERVKEAVRKREEEELKEKEKQKAYVQELTNNLTNSIGEQILEVSGKGVSHIAFHIKHKIVSLDSTEVHQVVETLTERFQDAGYSIGYNHHPEPTLHIRWHTF